MLRLLSAFFSSKIIGLTLRLFASLATAIFVVSGYLFFISIHGKANDGEMRENEIPDSELDNAEEGDEQN